MLIEASGPGHAPSSVETLDDGMLRRCFAGLDEGRGLLLAVSGGPDSMALLLLAARWSQRFEADAPPMHIATVDHGLRPESHFEAKMVGKVADDLGLPHATLTWAGPKPATRRQERARAARYALLADHARRVGARHILTAHHADDQAETVLFRLGRGSGIVGLSGIHRLSTLAPGLTLVRPLLDLTKAQLTAICRAESCVYLEDPSNRDAAYARVRLRRQAPALKALGLDTPDLVRLARRMARANEALDAETDRIETMLGPDREPGLYRADLTRARDLKPEIGVRLIGRAVAHVAGMRGIRLDRLESLAEQVWSALGDAAALRATLAGTRVSLDRRRILTVVPEAVRRRGSGQPRDTALEGRIDARPMLHLAREGAKHTLR